ncbi:hypothetical protein [Nostoc sp. ChiSLP03a]|uniref:hypothetical protein n=1 Tax=Nostoc sp. ChiSLP03a TaxID=3075380 RepID=UPI002AD524BE|nr:hypothetical protein [Nostoc sp. ChiSLP03a]MDZ8214233.1 hypothetical protein [Nostoc sp. ChiSLP03a]
MALCKFLGVARIQYSNLGENGSWAIVEKETTTIVGTIILKQLPDKDGLPTQDYEVGWHLRRASWSIKDSFIHEYQRLIPYFPCQRPITND